MMSRIFLAVVLVASMVGIARGQDEIVIGEYGSMTGGTATFGTSTDEGLRLALDQINASGGVLGKQIRVVVEDDQSKPEAAVTAVQKLIAEDHVIAVIGEVASSRSLAAAPVCQRAHIPMISPASTNPKVTKVGNFIFRACFIDPFQGAAMANFAMKDPNGPKAKRFAILYDVKNDYSVGLRQFFTDTVKANGGEIVADESYGEGDIDFKAQLTNIEKTSPDAIYLPGYYTEVGLICREARDLGMTVPLMGGDGWDSDKTYEIGRDAVNGCYFTNHYSQDDQSPRVRNFVTAYQAKYNGKTPDAMAILGYDAMGMLAAAIKTAGSTDGRAIRDAIAQTKDYPGASGDITMDKQRNAQKPIVVLKIENDQPHFVARVEPDSK
jgi:branched-chain amino acid transport system substrate-binding protein